MLVVVEFPSMARAREWYGSADYAEALKVRRAGALERRLVFVEGCSARGAPHATKCLARKPGAS